MLRVQVGAKLPRDVLDSRVTDARKDVSALGTHVEGHATLLLFLRPFGCIGCNQQVGRVLPRLRELDDAGVRVVLVGLGRPEHIPGFLELFGAESARLEVYTDTDGLAHRAAGLERSVRSTYGLRAIVGK